MRITICLVSKGRKDYLRQALQSYEDALALPETDVLLIDNGSGPDEEQTMREWASRFPKEVTYYRNVVNDIHPAQLFSTMRDHDLGWVVLPGDDDIFEVSVLEKIRERVRANPKLVAIGSSAQVINELGELRNEKFSPFVRHARALPEALAAIFHEPAFTWPALFFDMNALPKDLPNSRYVFDWWVGTQLILAGEYQCIQEIGIKYRVHSGQESNLTGTRRKFIEANLMLHELIEDTAFIEVLQRMSSADLSIFWKSFLTTKPVYGNEELFHGLAAHLLQLIRSRTSHKDLSFSLSGDYAANAGIFLAAKDSNNFFTPIQFAGSELTANVKLVVTPKSCAYSKELLHTFDISGATPSFVLSCHHDPDKEVSLKFDCQKLRQLPNDDAIDFILKSLTESLEESGALSFSISSGEKWVINQLRKSRRFLPGWLITKAKTLKR
jgi:hypothetical protein